MPHLTKQQMSTDDNFHIHIGLELHCQLNTTHKLFCNCSTRFGDAPNSNVCPICLGYPGVLPRLNVEAMRKAYIMAMCLQCSLSTATAFARKNYFYPDLPKNYQISQFTHPVGRNGSMVFYCGDSTRTIAFEEVHLEEDAGKMMHSGDSSLLDFNRTGTPLLEMVTKPQLRTAQEATALVLYMRDVVRDLDISDGNMEEGSLRCDANISVSRSAELPPYKVELKNMNSARFVGLALSYEIERQQKLLDEGKVPQQETRLWNENKDITVPMRSKEIAMDYRYFPEPDLPTFVTTDDFLTQVADAQIELPYARRQRLVQRLRVEIDDIPDETLIELVRQATTSKQLASYFEAVLARCDNKREALLWVTGDVKKLMRRYECSVSDCALSAERLAYILNQLNSNTIHAKLAKKLAEMVFEHDADPAVLIERFSLATITDGALQDIVKQVLLENADAKQEYQQGNTKIIGYLMGMVMKQSNGQADPQQAQQLLRAQLSDAK